MVEVKNWLDWELIRERREKGIERFGLKVGDIIAIAENTGYGYGRIYLAVVTEWNINGFWKVKLDNGEREHILHRVKVDFGAFIMTPSTMAML